MKQKKQGRLLDVKDANIMAYILSDLHGNLEDFKQFEKLTNIKSKLKNDEAILIINGDAVDRGKDTPELMEEIHKYKNKFGNKIIYTLGNHDLENIRIFGGYYYECTQNINPFSPYLDFDQEMYFHQFDYVLSGEMTQDDAQLFVKAPLAVRLQNKIILTHAGPSKEKFPIKDLKEEPPKGLQDLLWGRHKSFKYDEANYTNEDVKHFLEKTKSNILINGHTPVKEGYRVFGNNNIILSSSHRTPKEKKCYLEIDLNTTYETAKKLIRHCLKRLYK